MSPMVYDLLFALFCAMILIQLFFYLFFYARLAFARVEEKLPRDISIPVSIILCAYNEADNLRENLPRILEQSYERNGVPNYEILVVNDNSNDETEYILAELQQQYQHLRVLNLSMESELIKGKKFPLSMGIKSARNKHLLLTDSDCVPASREWLSGMASGFHSDRSIVLGYGAYHKLPGSLNKHIRFETFYTALQYFSFAMAGIPYMGVGRNLAYLKSLFEENKGFSSHYHLMSGDDDLFINQVANKKNCIVQIHPDTFTYSNPKLTWEQWRLQKKRHMSTGRSYKLKHKVLLGLNSLSHFLSYLILPFLMFDRFYFFIALGFFLFRWLVVIIVQSRAMKKLQEDDLAYLILYYDIWILFYYLRNIPSLFLSARNQRWK